MTEPNDLNLVIVSDLHLSEGLNRGTRKFNLNEDFFFDEKFNRFLNYLQQDSVKRKKKWRLIIAGDMADFLQVTRLPEPSRFPVRPREEEYGLGTSPEKTVWKLSVMMDGHRTFFQALGGFLRSGHRLTIISGNHDVEWIVPDVQEAFRRLMKDYLPKYSRGKDRVVSRQIEFCPWFYYEPELIWVEHGHQYDGMNSFDYPLFPYLPGSTEMMLPAGSFFVRYLFNKVEQKHPFADNIKPTSAYVRRYWLSLLLSPRVVRHVRSFWEIIKKLRKFESWELEPLVAKNEEGMKAGAVRFGIEETTLRAIRGQWVRSFLYNESKAKNLWRFVTYETRGAHRRVARQIADALGVRYVVFGHTHDADLRVPAGSGEREYVNAGTWTKIFSQSPGDRLLREEQESVFVEILKDEENRMELMKWKDELGCGERVHLFA